MTDQATTAPDRDLDRLAKDLKPSKFAHFVLTTSQYEVMIAWYKAVLNAEEVFRNDMLCFMTYDDEHHRLAIANVPGLQPAPPRTRGLAHVAYSYRNLGELLANYRRLKAQGIEPYWPINHGMTVSMYYKDPDGNAVEFQADSFASTKELKDYFASAAFRENPVGVIFDPEQMARDYEAGVPLEVLTARPDLKEGQSWRDMLRG